jgi:hypothetical protein
MTTTTPEKQPTQEQFLHGECCEFAIALAQRYPERIKQIDMAWAEVYYKDSTKPDEFICIHAMAVFKGIWCRVDAAGQHFDEYLDEWADDWLGLRDSNPDEESVDDVEIEILEFEGIEAMQSHLAAHGFALSKSAIAEAHQFIEQNLNLFACAWKE